MTIDEQVDGWVREWDNDGGFRLYTKWLIETGRVTVPAAPAASPVADADGWVTHDGSGMPVPGDTIVDILCANGNKRFGYNARTWYYDSDWWSGRATVAANNIIAYRIVDTKTPRT